MRTLLYFVFLIIFFLHLGCEDQKVDNQVTSNPLSNSKATVANGITKEMSSANKAGVLTIQIKQNGKLNQSNCSHHIIWDDHAIEFYKSAGKPECVIQLGKKAIPIYEKIRKKRGLPPGSYENFYQEIRRLKQEILSRQEENRILETQSEIMKNQIPTNAPLAQELGVSLCCSNLSNSTGITEKPLRWFAQGCDLAEQAVRAKRPMEKTEKFSDCILACQARFGFAGARNQNIFCTDGCETFTINNNKGSLRSIPNCGGD